MKIYKRFICIFIGLFIFVVSIGFLSACSLSKDKTTYYTVIFDDSYGNKVDKKIAKNGFVESFIPETPSKFLMDDNGNLVDSGEKENITFYGWYSDAKCTTEFDFSTPITSNVTLYARWTGNFTLSFETNGGTSINSLNIGVINSQSELEELTGVEMTKEGYAFKGWYTDLNCQTPVVYPYILTGNKTFYAKWDVEGFLVTFYCVNGQECNTPFNVLVANQKLGLYIENDGSQGIKSINSYVRENSIKEGDKFYGYTFKGWYTDPTFESKIEESDYLNIVIDKSMNIYGKFEINYYEVTINYNINGKNEYNNNKISKQYKSILNESELMTITIDSQEIKIENEGQRIKGWYLDASYTQKYEFTTLITKNITLYAEWENINGYIQIDYNGGTLNGEQKSELEEEPEKNIDNIFSINIEEPSRKGYVFKGWSYSYDNDFVCTWYKGEINGEYSEYSCTNGTKKYIYTKTSGADEIEIYRWYLDGDVGSELANYSFTYFVKTTDNKSLVALWKENEYTVVFNFDESNVSIDGKFTYDSIIDESDVNIDEKDGYDIVGFSIVENQETCDNTNICFVFPMNVGKIIEAGNDNFENNEITLYAVYLSKPLEIIFNSNGGSFGNTSISNYRLPDNAVSEDHIIRYGDEWDYSKMTEVFFNRIQNPQLYLARTNYTFVGWSTNKNATEDECQYTHANGNSLSFTIATTYYAIWKNDTKNLTFYYYNGSVSTSVAVPVKIGTRLNVYSYMENIDSPLDELDKSTDKGQYIGWYYCQSGINCEVNESNRLNVDTYLTVNESIDFHPEFSSTYLEYKLVNDGESKNYIVSGVDDSQTYIEVSIPSYYLGFSVTGIENNVFEKCTNIEKLSIPETILYDSIKGVFRNSLKIVELSVNKDIFDRLASKNDSIFGENATHMLEEKIASLNVIDVDDVSSLKEILENNGFDALVLLNGELYRENKLDEEINFNLLVEDGASVVAIGIDGYPSAYKAGYEFMGWRYATEGQNEKEYIQYIYVNDGINPTLEKDGNISGYIIDSSINEYIDFESESLDLTSNSYLIAVFEKLSNELEIDEVDGFPLYTGRMDSGDLIYDSIVENELIENVKFRKDFIGFYYDKTCINPVLIGDTMPYTTSLKIYAKFLSSMNMDVELTDGKLEYTISSTSINDLYIAKYYKGNKVDSIKIKAFSSSLNVNVNEAYIPAGYTIGENISISPEVTISNIVIYGSSGDIVKKSDINELNSVIKKITLYDNLSVLCDTFDDFELLESFDVINTDNDNNNRLFAVNGILFRLQNNSYHLIRVPRLYSNGSNEFSTSNLFVGASEYVATNLVRIEAHALFGCDSINKIVVSSSITYIGEKAFANMSKLVSIEGMANVKTIEDMNAFENTSKLENISVNIGSGNYTSIAGVLLDINKVVLYHFPSNYEFSDSRIYYVPTTVETIKKGAFDLRGSDSIIVNISPSVKEIEDGAFYNISEFRISSSTVFAVDKGNLYNYRTNNGSIELFKLIRYADASEETMYVLPNTLESINPLAFANAKKLSNIIYDDKVTVNSKNNGIEKDILVGSFNKDDVEVDFSISPSNWIFNNITDGIKFYGYTENAYRSIVINTTLNDLYNTALNKYYEKEFREWLRDDLEVLTGSLDKEDEELASLKITISAGNLFLVNDTPTGVGDIVTNRGSNYENLKFSYWLHKMGLEKENSKDVSLRDGKYYYIGNEDSGLTLKDVGYGEMYLRFNDSLESISNPGLEWNTKIENYEVLSAKEIKLVSIAPVTYKGEKLEEKENNGVYLISDDGIISVEPQTEYENLVFRGWYKEDNIAAGLYSTRFKFPLMINDLKDENPSLSAAFTTIDFVTELTLNVDYDLKSFEWNGIEYTRPEGVEKGYWTVNIKTTGDNSLSFLDNEINSSYSLYYKKSTITDGTYTETYKEMETNFFTTLGSLKLYILPNNYFENPGNTLTLVYEDGSNKKVETSYFDIDEWCGDRCYLLPAASDSNAKSKVAVEFEKLDTTGMAIKGNTTYYLYEKSSIRTNVTIKINSSDEKLKDYKLLIGTTTYASEKTENIYVFKCIDDYDSGAAGLNAIAGGILDFTTIRVIYGNVSYSFEEIFGEVKVDDDDSIEGNKFYLSNNDVTFTTSLK